ncbi:MAG: histidinol-phosphate transaminase [Candidatus Bathyarchaeia archaeon]
MKNRKLLRKEVLKIPVYETEYFTAEIGGEDFVKLDLNENLVIEANFMKSLLTSACKDIDPRFYPPARGMLALKAISKFYGLDEEMIIIGNGSDELLDLLAKAFIKNKTKVLIVEPTFPFYDFFVKLYGGDKIEVLLKPDFEPDVGKILELQKKASILILCSPNNPTGNQFKEDNVKALLEEFKGLIVIDEAYVEFAKYSVLGWIKKFDNLIVLRTFSKAFGLAGIRAGLAVSSPSIIEYLRRVALPFNMGIVAQKMIALALENWSYFKEQINQIIQEREWLFKKLNEINGVKPFPSDASFILLKVTKKGLKSSTVKERLQKRKVLVKDRGMLPLLDNCLRVSIGTRKMNEAFVQRLKEVLEEES